MQMKDTVFRGSMFEITNRIQYLYGNADCGATN